MRGVCERGVCVRGGSVRGGCVRGGCEGGVLEQGVYKGVETLRASKNECSGDNTKGGQIQLYIKNFQKLTLRASYDGPRWL